MGDALGVTGTGHHGGTTRASATSGRDPGSTRPARSTDLHDDPFMAVLRQGVYDFVVHSATLGPGIVVTTQQPTA